MVSVLACSGLQKLTSRTEKPQRALLVRSVAVDVRYELRAGQVL